MKLSCRSSLGAAVLMLAAGCSTTPLQRDATGSGGAGGAGGVGWIDPARDAGFDPPDVGTAIDTGDLPDVSADRGPPTMFSGRRSFFVTATLPPGTADAAVPIPAPPSSHTFTLVLDGDRQTAFVGGAGEGIYSSFYPSSGGFRIAPPLTFALNVGCQSSVRYDDFHFTISGNTLRGYASGQMLLVIGDVGTTSNVTATLGGVVDMVAPTLTIRSVDVTDPFSGLTAFASEPLPPGVNPMLVSAGGESILLNDTQAGIPFVRQFSKPTRMLLYGEQYRVMTDGLTDYAGNVAAPGQTFTTRPLPPLAPEDGFESVTDSMLGGAQVLSGDGAPVITGARSLYVSPVATPATPGPRLLIRLPVEAGDTRVVFNYRNVNPDTSPAVSFVLGSPGRSITPIALPGDPVMTTPATINGTTVMLGPGAKHMVRLPDDVTSEIVIQRTVQPPGCGGPLPPVRGIIIDDLVVE